LLVEYNQFSFLGTYLINNLYKTGERIKKSTARAYLNNILKELNLEMHLCWTTEDVLRVVQNVWVKNFSDRHENNISIKDAKLVLKYAYDYHDKRVGVNYQTIESIIQKMLNRNQIKLNI